MKTISLELHKGGLPMHIIPFFMTINLILLYNIDWMGINNGVDVIYPYSIRDSVLNTFEWTVNVI